MHRSAKKSPCPLADEVLQYLNSQKRAHDTVAGIVAWWLPLQKINYAIAEVEAALRELVANGLVVERRTPDGGIHYHINPRAESAIRRRLGMNPSRARGRAKAPRQRLKPD